MSIFNLVVLLCIFIPMYFCQSQEANNESLAPKVYVKLLQARRRDHKALIQSMLNNDFSKNYKLLSIALEKIFQVIAHSNRTLAEENYKPSAGFPTHNTQQEAVTSILENTCLASDIILHFPELSYKILGNIADWKDNLNWCIGFVNYFPHITDELIVQLMDLIYQEINEEARSSDFINPYYKKRDADKVTIKKKFKTPKKIKKGPQLTSRTDL